MMDTQEILTKIKDLESALLRRVIGDQDPVTFFREQARLYRDLERLYRALPADMLLCPRVLLLGMTARYFSSTAGQTARAFQRMAKREAAGQGGGR